MTCPVGLCGILALWFIICREFLHLIGDIRGIIFSFNLYRYPHNCLYFQVLCNYRVSLFRAQSNCPLKPWAYITGMCTNFNFSNSAKWNTSIFQIQFFLVPLGLPVMCNEVWLYKKQVGHFLYVIWLVAKWHKKFHCYCKHGIFHEILRRLTHL